MPAIIFLTVILFTLGAIFALENLLRGKEAAGSRGRFDSHAEARARTRWAATGSNGESETVHSGAAEGSFRRRS